jgi:hypothetical protein
MAFLAVLLQDRRNVLVVSGSRACKNAERRGIYPGEQQERLRHLTFQFRVD